MVENYIKKLIEEKDKYENWKNQALSWHTNNEFNSERKRLISSIKVILENLKIVSPINNTFIENYLNSEGKFIRENPTLNLASSTVNFDKFPDDSEQLAKKLREQFEREKRKSNQQPTNNPVSHDKKPKVNGKEVFKEIIESVKHKACTARELITSKWPFT